MIGAAIYGILSGATGVTNLIGTRIYPDIAPQNAAYPFVLYSIEGTDPSDTKDGASSLDVVEFTVTVFSESYDNMSSIAAATRTALDAKAPGAYGGITLQSIRFAGQQSMRMDVGKHVYVIEQTYNARHQR